MSLVVVATPDVVGEKMAGPGIRAYHFARELAAHAEVALVGELKNVGRDEPFRAVPRGTREARDLYAKADWIIGQPTRELLAIKRKKQRFAWDLFDPVVLELSNLAPYRPKLRHTIHVKSEWGRLLRVLGSDDILICASRRQRDFYSGVQTAASQPIEGFTDRWVEIPFGVDPQTPHAADVARIGDGPPVLLWGGGTWPWLDPETAVKAVVKLNKSGVDCRLMFLGTSHPNSDVTAVGQWFDRKALEEEGGRHVLWNEGWVPYAERGRWLLASRLAVMLHHKTLECEFSIRTRFFDALWCGVPVVASAGGMVADLVRREELGVVVEPDDVNSVFDGIRRLLADSDYEAECRANLARIRPRFFWSHVVRPLVEIIRKRS